MDRLPKRKGSSQTRHEVNDFDIERVTLPHFIKISCKNYNELVRFVKKNKLVAVKWQKIIILKKNYSKKMKQIHLMDFKPQNIWPS